jgi:organic radical activating enzyme
MWGGWDFFFSDEFTLLYNNIALPVYALYEADKLVLSSGCFIPSTVCNLNCRNCLNFTPYIREFETRTIESLKADVDLLFHTIDYFGRFQISGGEPMLYPKLNELIAYIGEHYRGQIGCFETVMNGTIVPDDDICRSAKKYELTMILDNYVNEIPPQMNHRSEIIAQFERFELLWLDNTVEDWFDLDIDGTDNTDMTEEQLQEWFDICNMPWHNYENGRFYTCNFARFAEKAGIHSEPETSSYSIKEFTPQKKKELLEFSLHYNEKGYVELCKHCSGWGECNPKRVSVAVQSLRGER